MIPTCIKTPAAKQPAEGKSLCGALRRESSASRNNQSLFLYKCCLKRDGFIVFAGISVRRAPHKIQLAQRTRATAQGWVQLIKVKITWFKAKSELTAWLKNTPPAEDVAIGRRNGAVLPAASPAPVLLSRLRVCCRVCVCAACCANEVVKNAVLRFCKLPGSL